MRAWRGLDRDRRIATIAALAILATMFLPWYQRDTTAFVDGRPVSASQNLNAFQVFTFVEAATLLVIAALLALLFARAEQRDFHLPARDGTLVCAAGVWICLLIFYRQLDRPEPLAGAQASASVGVNWGIFLAFLAAIVLGAVGFRMRVAEQGEHQRPMVRDARGGATSPTRDDATPPTRTAATHTAPAPGASDQDVTHQLSFDDPENAAAQPTPAPPRPGEVPSARDRR
ncbi:MAG: hypothetical protein M3459_12370 [Actinomycetota bacterium]|nr:hypothetical protein [Actinomycetota bacterium]